MKTLPWKPFSWAGKWFQCASPAVASNFSVSHAAQQHEQRGVMCISCNIWEKQNKLWRNKPSQVWFLGQHYRKNIFQSLKWDFTHNPEYRGKEKVIRGYTRIHLNSCLIHPKRSIWLHPNAPRLSAIALHMVNISHRGAGVPQMLLSYGCLAAA